ncbi:hypothetical protein COLO4_03903 [Corchorus olitorius]|uniref:Uncharacterized protein n=1 Tax=Corchorus olitorius TaxID=93759 RepID=A0A1R3KW42_9ROSI|nr:hypothetical protein COLO4_03903 [Corchorus olitorius]
MAFFLEREAQPSSWKKKILVLERDRVKIQIRKRDKH